MPRIGLFGGTFDPVHLAHLRTAEEVREALAPRPRRARARRDAAAQGTRHASAGRSTAAACSSSRSPAIRISRSTCSELEREGPSYSIDTIRTVAGARARRGAHASSSAPTPSPRSRTWKEYATLFTLCDVCVISRPGAPNGELPIAVENAFCYELESWSVRPSLRSSTPVPARHGPHDFGLGHPTTLRHRALDPLSRSRRRRRLHRRSRSLRTGRTAAR